MIRPRKARQRSETLARANHSAFVHGRFLVQYLAPNSRPKVAGVFHFKRGLYFTIQKQKQRRIGRIYLFRFPSFMLVFPPNLHAKKIFEA